MNESDSVPAITYPRRRLQRGASRLFGRLLLPLFFRVRLQGKENFPKSGPLIVVGNHSAAMEVVLLTVYTPWMVEILGGGDIPHERVTEVASRFFGYIPYPRGDVDRDALRKALSVLEQDGVLGIFPEGGIWQTTERQVQSGVAWLSQRAKAPVLPICFTGAEGALGKAVRLKRPELQMRVGRPIPPMQLVQGKPRKEQLQAYANRTMDAVDALCPERRQAVVRDETFELEIALHDASGESITVPEGKRIRHPEALGKLLHSPRILKIFTSNLKLPTTPLQTLSRRPSAEEIQTSCGAILHYLSRENPYLLTYRFPPKEAEAMKLGVQELFVLAEWAKENGYNLKILPKRVYFDPVRNERIIQTEQGAFENWM